MRKIFYILPLLFLSVISFAQPGTLDNTYHGSGISEVAHLSGAIDQAFGMAVYNDERVVLVGVRFNGTDVDFAVVRYDATGVLDGTFGGGDGMVTIPIGTSDDIAINVAIQPDGKIVVAGYAIIGGANDFAVVRLNADGTPDTGFGGGDGIVTTNIAGDDRGNAIALQPDGKILLGGNSDNDFVAARYNTDGSLDMTGFGGGDGIATLHVGGAVQNYGYGMVLQPDGKILLSGFIGTGGPFGPGDDIAVVRFNDDGTPDLTGFGAGNGFVTTDVGTGSADQSLGTNVALQTDGSFYVTGASDLDFATIYYNSDGTLNNAFGGDGKVVTNVNGTDQGYSVYIQNDNRVVVAGASGNSDFTAIRYNVDGTPDLTFGGAGTGISATDINAGSQDISFTAKLGRSRVYIGGTVLAGPGNDQDFVVVALQNDASPLPLNLLSFTAQKQNSEIALNWKTEKEAGITQFIVERSSDGRNFSSIGSLTPSKLNTLVSSYSFSDKQPLPAVNYYRLAIKELDESTIHSKVVAIKFNKKIQDLEIFPNPAVDNSVRMQLPDGLKGHISVQIADASGRLMKTASYELQGGSSIATTLDVSSLQKGVYFISIKTTNNGTITKRFVKN